MPIATATQAIGIISKNNWQIVNGGRNYVRDKEF